jgi:signal transduction histidine kinase
MEILIGLALGWLTFALGYLVYRPARLWLHRQRYGASVDHSLLLVEYGRKMVGVPDQESLAKLLTVELARALQVRQAALLLPEDHLLAAVNMDDLRLPVSHAPVRWVASGGEAQRADRGRLRELIRQGRGDLAWTRAWVPLMRGTELRGLWLLGERDGGIPYAPEDLHCLTSLARQAAAVLEATHYAEQEQQVASEMQALYRQLVAVREAERARLARELHDGLLQDLCAVTRDLRASETQVEASGELNASLAARSGATVDALRAICNDLRPPLLQHDLASALRALVEELDMRSPAPVRIDVAGPMGSLPDDTALAIFRITQEALHNAIQHADASEVAVRLTGYPDRLRLTVTDDGQGITGGVDPIRFVAQGHFGIVGMRERASMIGGKLDVQTAADYGTVVILELPL